MNENRNRESVKRFIKNCIPWQMRYFIKLQEAKGNIKLAKCLKQHRPIEEYNSALISALDAAGLSGSLTGKTICELGPGEYLSHAAMEYQMGAEQEYLLEIADFAGLDGEAKLENLHIGDNPRYVRQIPEAAGSESWRSYLQRINAVYSISALNGYRAIPNESVDFVFSFYVLEHIRKNVFPETMQEVYRFMKNGAVSYHTADFTDHMGGRKNHLKFSEEVWENAEHYNMDIYTNRISCSEMCMVLEKTGFEIVKIAKLKFRRVPLKRSALAAGMEQITDEDLLTARVKLVLRKP